MKSKYLIFIFLLALYSCEGVEIVQERGKGKPVNMFAEIEKATTRAYDDKWESGDAIGVFTKSAGQSLETAALDKNKKYVTDGSSAFQAASDLDLITLPSDGVAIDFISYYPYSSDISDFIFPVDVYDQSNQAAIDLLYCNNVNDINFENPNVNLSFSHCLTKIVLNITHEVPETDLSNMEILLANAPVNADFSLVEGSMGTPNKTDDIRVKMSSDGKSGEAIVIPCSNLTGMELWFKIPGTDSDPEQNPEQAESIFYKYPLENSLDITSFDKATKYTYNVTIGVDIEPIIEAGSISTWTDGPTENIEPERTTDPYKDYEEPDNAYEGDGSEENPYNRDEAVNNQGKEGVWVKGYIVGSMDGSSGPFYPGIENASKTNITLADNKSETDYNKTVVISLGSSSQIASELNLADNPENYNKRVLLKGDLSLIFSIYGMNKITEYKFVDP